MLVVVKSRVYRIHHLMAAGGVNWHGFLSCFFSFARHKLTVLGSRGLQVVIVYVLSIFFDYSYDEEL